MTATRAWAVALTGAALLMITLDALIVVTTLPAMQADLGISVDRLQWVVDAYILAYAVLTLTGAALGDRFGRRRVFGYGVALFTLGSAAAAVATGFGLLIAARTVQGAGAGILMPLTLTLLASAFSAEERGRALGLWSSLAGLGVALGPLAGGIVVHTLDWHWIFWINVPVGISIIVLAPRHLEERRGAAQPLDLAGLLLAAGALLGLVWATSRGNAEGWMSVRTLGAYAVGAFLSAGFIARQRTAAAPLLPLSLFASRAFSAINAATFLFYFAMFAAFTFVIQDLVHAHGASALEAGVETLPWTVMPLVVSPFAGTLGSRVGQRPLVAAGLSLVAIGTAGLAVALATGAGYLWIVVPLVLTGLGIGTTLPNIAGIALAAAPAHHLGKASGAINTVRQVGAVFGVAIAVAVFERAGAYTSPDAVASGASAAILTASAAALGGALLTLAVPGSGRSLAGALSARRARAETVPSR